jgi:hypothetical protein
MDGRNEIANIGCWKHIHYNSCRELIHYIIIQIGNYLSILHIEINDVKVCVGKYQVTDCIVTLQPLCIQRRIHIHIPQM